MTETKNIKVTIEVHERLKKYCEDNFLKLNNWVSHILSLELDKLEKIDKKL